MRTLKSKKQAPRKHSKAALGRVPLERAISKLGAGSRQEARHWILDGRVKVHGTVELDPLRTVNPDRAHIEIAGQKITKPPSSLILFHKPVGCLTTKRDPENRKTIYDYLPDCYHSYHPVGRLDQNTSGLLLLTNDTRLSHVLTDPRSQVERTYVVGVRGCFTTQEIIQAERGVWDEGEHLAAKSVRILKASGKESKIEIILTEGKNREIRRLCMSLGHEVISLKRIAYGPYHLEQVRPGEVKEVDVAAFQFNVKIKE